MIQSIIVGVEIECHLPRGVLGSWGTRRSGYHDCVPMSDRPGWRGPSCLEDWRAERDGSLPEGRQRMGVEFVSPQYRWPRDLPILMDAIRQIRLAGATTSRACGGHIHVSFDRYSMTVPWDIWQAELSYRQFLITEPMAGCGWRIGHHYAEDGALWCARCNDSGRCVCPVDRGGRSTFSPAKHARPGAIWRVGSDNETGLAQCDDPECEVCIESSGHNDDDDGRIHVEARAWKGSVSGSRWAARIGATIDLLSSDPRKIDMTEWSRAYRSFHSPVRRSVGDTSDAL